MSKKFSELPPKESLDSADYIPIVDSADSNPETQNKIVTFQTVRGYFTEDLDEFLEQAQTAESARVSAENTRRSNETTRQSNETTRQSNETTRQANEATRQANETARENAETGYIQQAKSWAVGTNGVARTGDATDNAKYYAEQASASASSASTSATNASTSETNAATSAQSAQASATQAAISAESVDAPELTRKILAAFPQESLSGQLVTLSDGADGIPAKKVTLNLSPHQSGSGDPSPDNVRPISGYQSVTVTRAGKNLASVPDTVFAMGDVRARTFNNPITLPAGTYTLSVTLTDSTKTKALTVAVRNSETGSENIAVMTFGAAESGRKSLTFTSAIPIDRFYVYLSTSEEEGKGGTLTNFMLEAGSAATDYAAYITPAEYDIPTAAGTVYGGSLTVNDDGSGTLTVDRALVEYDGSADEVWTYSTNRFIGSVISDAVNVSSRVEVVSNKGKFAAVGTTAGTIFLFGGCVYYYAPTEITTVADFKDWLASSPMQVVYPLATPTTYTLTAEQVTTLLGDNTLWMDADGTIDLVYRADTQKYIDSRIALLNSNLAFIEDSMTASRAYSVGQYVLISGQLYKVAASIASGATFTIGTNVVSTTVGTELTALN